MVDRARERHVVDTLPTGLFIAGAGRPESSGGGNSAAATPWIWRVAADGSVASHTGAPAQVQSCLVDESGRLYLVPDRGLGLVHTQDVVQASEMVESGRWQPQEVRADELPARFGFVRSPGAVH